MSGEQVLGYQNCVVYFKLVVRGSVLGWVRASTRVLNVVCGVKRQEIVVINGKVFFNSADYNMIINVTRLARLLRLQLG